MVNATLIKRALMLTLSVFFALGFLLVSAFFLYKPFVYHTFIDLMNPSFETVSNTTIEQDANILILDTRSKPEFEVSHIPNALWVGFEEFERSKIIHFPKDTAIVVYCSVGYRSALIGQELEKAGFTNVKNLYGGIFEWLNKGLLITNQEGQAVDTVHGFSPFWGIWLEKGTVVYESSHH